MNQPQQLKVACDFQGFLVCQMPTDVVEVKLKIKKNGENSPYPRTYTPGHKNTGLGTKSVEE